MKVYHTSPEKIEKISKRDFLNDCLFFSSTPYAMGNVKYIYSLEVETLPVSSFFYRDDYDKINEIVDEVKNYTDTDEETAQGLLDGSINEYDVLDAELAGELGWYIQSKQGEAAKLLGFDGAEAEDEQGSVYIIPMYGREKELMEEVTY